LEDRLIVARAARDAAIRDRHRQGIGPTQIAREVGITRQAVYNVLVNQLDPDRSVV
jgi:DNA-binding phage protein